jgi:putative toxin-antitoxin system antitoxin component (TIGR02293 family)
VVAAVLAAGLIEPHIDDQMVGAAMCPIEVRISKVMAALGGARAAGSTPHTVVELAEAVANGLSRAVVSELAANAAPNEAAARRRVSALVTSAASLKRRARLSPEASERAERRARIVALARQALGDDDEARGWLNDPHPLLGAARHDRCWRDRPLCATGGEDPAQHREGSAGLTQLVEWARPSAATNVGCT